MGLPDEYPDNSYIKDIEMNVCLTDINKKDIRIINSIKIESTQYKLIKDNCYYHFISDEWWQHCKANNVINLYPIVRYKMQEQLDLIRHPHRGIWIWKGKDLTIKGAEDFLVWKKMVDNTKKGHLIELTIENQHLLSSKLKKIGYDDGFCHSFKLGNNIIHEDRNFDIYLNSIMIEDISYICTIEEVVTKVNAT